jgi:error-prone DNA polymerase
VPTLLNVHSCFSPGAAISTPRVLVERAVALGYSSLALTDITSVGGAVELHDACRERGARAIIGATLPIRADNRTNDLVFIAPSREAYAALNRCITEVLDGAVLTLEAVAQRLHACAVLTSARGGRLSQLLLEGDHLGARVWLETLQRHFGRRVFAQLFHETRRDDGDLARQIHAISSELEMSAVIAPDVRYAAPEQWIAHDALTCARLGIDLETPHATRPLNDGQAIASPEELRSRLPFPDAWAYTERLAERLSFDLLPERVSTPKVNVPEGYSSRRWLEARCLIGLRRCYEHSRRGVARARLQYELSVIASLGLEDFFLTCATITDYCRERGIYAAGRGSAAASVVCYALGVSFVDPLKHDLLFERFLHGGKRAMPDVDIDISSARRREVIAWIESTYGANGGEAMVANRITYRLPSAVRDVARALGLPVTQVDELTRKLGREYRALRPHRARDAIEIFNEVLGDAPLMHVLLNVLERCDRGLVRHLAPHSGGVILASQSLEHYSPLWTSTGGLRCLQFDKDDIETLGLIKYDCLGLRMLSSLENALEDINWHEGISYDPRAIEDHPRVWARIRSGDTLGIFQIESPGQQNISVRLQARDFYDLGVQIAIHRPGPIQSGSVHPYLERRDGREVVTYAHAALKPILERTLGVLLFQEQVLRIVHVFTGLDWLEADHFTKRLSLWETEDELAPLRKYFLEAAASTVGATEEQALTVFAMCAMFRGYGFAESHALAFAQHAYLSAYLREFHPAAFFCGLLNHQPGMFNRRTIAQEAKRFGAKLLALDINRSGPLYTVEPVLEESADELILAMRVGLNSVKGLSENASRVIALERLHGHFGSVEDFFARVELKCSEYDALALAGAFDAFGPRNEVLFRLQVLQNALTPGETPLFAPDVTTPPLPIISDEEILRLNWKFKGLDESGRHPMDLCRHALPSLGVVALGGVRHRAQVLTVGFVIARQKPPTANGYAFWYLEDGQYRAQVVLDPRVYDEHRAVLRDAHVLIVEGIVYGRGSTRAIRAFRVWAYTSFKPGEMEGRDVRVLPQQNQQSAVQNAVRR